MESTNQDPAKKLDDAETGTSSLLSQVQSEDDTDLETRDITVVVDDPEKHTTTLEAYVTFRVITKTTRSEFDSCEFSVRRRYNDFLWLRQQLEETYCTHLLPPLPEKHSFTRLDRFSSQFLSVRQKALQKFLTRLADHPVLSFDKDFKAFLTAETTEFQTHKKQAKGILSHMSDSIYNMGASYMMKNRPLEFSLMQEYVTVFGEKLATLGRIVGRVVREQSEYQKDLLELAPYYTQWSKSEDELSAPLMAMSTAMDQCCLSLKRLMDDTDDTFAQPLREYVLYTDCIKAVLKRRDAIQMEYDTVADELNRKKDEREQVKISDQTYSFGAFLGKDPAEVKQQKQEKVAQQIVDLTRRMDEMNDKVEVANANLKADMERWHKTKQRDIKEILTTLADRQIQYYQTSLSVWEDAIRAFQKETAYTASLNDSGITTTANTTTTTTTTTANTAATTTAVSASDGIESVPACGDSATAADESDHSNTTGVHT